jgi:hypothetical protein
LESGVHSIREHAFHKAHLPEIVSCRLCAGVPRKLGQQAGIRMNCTWDMVLWLQDGPPSGKRIPSDLDKLRQGRSSHSDRTNDAVRLNRTRGRCGAHPVKASLLGLPTPGVLGGPSGTECVRRGRNEALVAFKLPPSFTAVRRALTRRHAPADGDDGSPPCAGPTSRCVRYRRKSNSNWW